MNYYVAKSLRDVPLNTQIVELGGKGFNADVVAEKMPHSFSVKYTFDTVEGRKTLVTRNEMNAGVVPGKGSIIFSKSLNNYYYCGHNRNILKLLGKTQEQAKKRLCEMFPEQLNIRFESEAYINNFFEKC